MGYWVTSTREVRSKSTESASLLAYGGQVYFGLTSMAASPSSRTSVNTWTKLVTTSNQCLPILTSSAHWNRLPINQQSSLRRHKEISSNPMNPKRHFEETLEMFAEYTAAASTIAHAGRNRLAMTNIRKMLLTFAITLMGLAVVALVYLVYPDTPSKSKVMTFEGFIELPRGGLLTVLDYLTVNDQTLFVTSESSGALFKIAFDRSDLKASTVSEMPGAGAAHGVAVLPDVNVAFITRSEANTVDVFDPKSLHQLASIPVADDPDAILYIPSTNLIYVAHGDPNMATLIDPEKRATVGTIQLPGKPEFPAIDSESGLLFQNLQD